MKLRDTRILITNDDGINSPSSLKLFKTLSDMEYIVRYIAPIRQQSGCGKLVTYWQQVRVWEERIMWGDRDKTAYALEGTPADCVIYAMNTFKPDYVISGINAGDNVSYQKIWNSGTCGAAIEAGFYRVPSIAISVQTNNAKHIVGCLQKSKKIFTEEHYKKALSIIEDDILERVVKVADGIQEPSDILFKNVNMPIEINKRTKIVDTIPALRHYDDRIIKSTDPRKVEVFWISGDKIINRTRDTVDVDVLYHYNDISISEIKLNHGGW